MGMRHSVCEPTTPDRPIPQHVPGAPRKPYKPTTPLFSPPRARLFPANSVGTKKTKKRHHMRSTGTQTDPYTAFDISAPYELVTYSMVERCRECFCEMTFVLDDLQPHSCFACGTMATMDRGIQVKPYYLLGG